MLNMNLVGAGLHHKNRKILMQDVFESFSFHDNAMHGIFLPEKISEGVSPLCIDIDHIIEMKECCVNGKTTFAVCQGMICFHDVTDLKINIAWRSSNFTTSETGTFIVDIKREVVETSLRLPVYYNWEIITNSDNYHISFGASSLSVNLIGEIKIIDRQYLLGDERMSVLQFTKSEFLPV